MNRPEAKEREPESEEGEPRRQSARKPEAKEKELRRRSARRPEATEEAQTTKRPENMKGDRKTEAHPWCEGGIRRVGIKKRPQRRPTTHLHSRGWWGERKETP